MSTVETVKQIRERTGYSKSQMINYLKGQNRKETEEVNRVYKEIQDLYAPPPVKKKARMMYVSPEPYDLAQMDVMFLHKIPVLVVVDVFSRYTWAQVTPSKTAEDMKQAFNQIKRQQHFKMPTEVMCDMGGEYADIIKEHKNTIWSQEASYRDHWKNSIVNRAISEIKKFWGSRQLTNSKNEVVNNTIIQKIVSGWNELPRKLIAGREPVTPVAILEAKSHDKANVASMREEGKDGTPVTDSQKEEMQLLQDGRVTNAMKNQRNQQADTNTIQVGDHIQIQERFFGTYGERRRAHQATWRNSKFVVTAVQKSHVLVTINDKTESVPIKYVRKIAIDPVDDAVEEVRQELHVGEHQAEQILHTIDEQTNGNVHVELSEPDKGAIDATIKNWKSLKLGRTDATPNSDKLQPEQFVAFLTKDAPKSLAWAFSKTANIANWTGLDKNHLKAYLEIKNLHDLVDVFFEYGAKRFKNNRDNVKKYMKSKLPLKPLEKAGSGIKYAF